MVARRLSWSQLSMLSRCGKQYEFRYIDGLKSPPSASLLVGSATHVSVQRDLESKLRDGTLLTDEEIRDVASTALDAAWTEDGDVVLEPDEDGITDVGVARGAARDRTVKLAMLHHDEVAPEIHPVGIEEAFSINIAGTDLSLSGRLDVREEAPVPGDVEGRTLARIRDAKTAGKSPAKDAADRSEQLTMYGLAHRVLVGREPDALILDHLVSTKIPKVVTQESTRDTLDYQRMLLRVEVASDALDAGTFLPAHPDSWWCSAKWCGYWHVCPFGGKGRTRPVTP